MLIIARLTIFMSVIRTGARSSLTRMRIRIGAGNDSIYEEFIYQVCLEVRIQPLLTLSVMSIYSP